MNKILNLLQPLIDHLYIFQLLEYQPKDLLRWFLKHPFKRHLQRKQHLELTAHIKALLLISITLISLLSYILCAGFFSFILLFIIFLQLSPIFIIIAEFLFKPLELFQKQRIVNAAINKRKNLTNLQVIAIVGSYAKTSTKNMLYTLLWKDFNVVKTPKSYNTELSIARSILTDLKNTTQIYICEMDAYHEGEIKKLCSIAQPTIGIITAIGPQHLQRFGTIETLAKTQFELANFLNHIHTKFPSPRGEGHLSREALAKWEGEGHQNVLFLNNNDDFSKRLVDESKNNIIWFADKKNFISDRKEHEHNQTFTLHLNKEKTNITLPLKGEHNAHNFLAAATIAHHQGLPLSTIAKRAKLITSTEHRLEVRTQGNTTILDNTYNANPKAALASLELLNSYKDTQKILITPGFVELGKEHTNAHIQFAKDAAKVANDIIIVGHHAKKPLLKGLQEANFKQEHIHLAETTSQALNHLSLIQKEGRVTILLENDLPDQYF